jgi:hypothetical protein
MCILLSTQREPMPPYNNRQQTLSVNRKIARPKNKR